MSEVNVTAGSFLAPGQNCWTVARADRFYAIQDGEIYYRLFRDAVLRAERSVFILSWDITGGTNLVPKEPAGKVPSRLDAFLRYAAKRRPKVDYLILTWDYGLVFTMERDPLTRWRLGWRTPRNVRLAFDDHHPVGASHHQKVVVIDDTLAFSGGMDLTGHRWDTCAHLVDDPARLDPTGRPYDPYHEVQAMIEGPAAAKLGELARERWRAVGAEELPPAVRPTASLWPQEITPDFTDVDVAISRTIPGTPTRPEVRECERLYLDAIARAKRTIYVENQYFTHPGISDAIAARLAESDGPEIVLVLPRGGDGWLDRNTISVIRDGLFRALAAADVHDRLRLVYPIASRKRDVTTFVHSKVLIVDDALVIVGSANTNRRSMGMDTECDVAVAADGGEAAAAITALRNRLAAEHLGMSTAEIPAALEGAGSLRALIDARQSEDRTLARFELTQHESEPVDDTVQYVVDPHEPMSLGGEIDELLPAAEGPAARVPLRLWISPLVVLVGAAIVAWSSFRSVDRSALSSLQATVGAIRSSPLPDAAFVVVFVIAGLALIPIELVLVAGGLLLGAGRGVGVAVGGSLALAVAGYAAGRLLGPAATARWMSGRAFKSIRQLGARGVRGVAMLRLAGVASTSAIHLLCGAARVPFGAYLTGTVIGLVPAVIALTSLGALLGHTLLTPTVGNALTTALVALVILGSALALRALLLVRQFAPAISRQRARAELG